MCKKMHGGLSGTFFNRPRTWFFSTCKPWSLVRGKSEDFGSGLNGFHFIDEMIKQLGLYSVTPARDKTNSEKSKFISTTAGPRVSMTAVVGLSDFGFAVFFCAFVPEPRPRGVCAAALSVSCSFAPPCWPSPNSVWVSESKRCKRWPSSSSCLATKQPPIQIVNASALGPVGQAGGWSGRL